MSVNHARSLIPNVASYVDFDEFFQTWADSSNRFLLAVKRDDSKKKRYYFATFASDKSR